MRTALSILGILVITAGLSSAQTSLGLNLYAGGGFTVPLEDIKDSWKLGSNIGGAFGYPLTPGLEGVGRYSYYSFPLEDDPDSTGLAETDEDLTVQEFAGELRAQLRPPGIRIRPYGIVGIGFAKFSDRTKFFYCVGGGLKFYAAPKIDLFVEMRYNWISIEDYSVNYIPITVGINLSL